MALGIKMEQIVNKERTLSSRPEWRIILEGLVYRDQVILYRICRRMIIYLNRFDIPEIKEITKQFTPNVESRKRLQSYGANLPEPIGSPFLADQLI